MSILLNKKVTQVWNDTRVESKSEFHYPFNTEVFPTLLNILFMYRFVLAMNQQMFYKVSVNPQRGFSLILR